MKVAFLCPSASRAYGGIYEIERRLAQELQISSETEVEVFAPRDEFTHLDLPNWAPIVPQHFPYYGPGAFRFSPGLRQAFLRCDADIAHLHGMWLHTSLIIQAWAQRKKRPFLTTINGMLEPWALAHSCTKKQLCAWLYERQALQAAGALHVNTLAELRSVRAFGLNGPVCVIPNGVDLPAGDSAGSHVEPRFFPGKKVLLYLGRLHPKKGLPNLLRAWAATCKEISTIRAEWVLAIAGWDQDGHERELKRLASDLGIKWSEGVSADPASLVFLGPQFGEAKAAIYAQCDALILPSFSEGLPMVILEAWAYAKPVLMTPACNLPDGFIRGAALSIAPSPDAIEVGIHALIEMSAEERLTMGRRGHALVSERYTWPQVALALRAVYGWILGGGSAPACVEIP